MSRLAVAIALGLAASMSLAAASDATDPADESSESSASADATKALDGILVTAQRAGRVSRGATGLDLDIKETPQSISVVTAEQMRDFGVDNLNDALRLATGINVEEWETNRTNYTARGFDVVNTQIDGIGMPNDWGIVTGAFDSFGYEKVEVIRGANGLLTGVGNASGTINYVRKRPGNEREGQLNISGGSWNNRRVEADYSTPFTQNQSWAGRFVAAYDEGDAHLDLLHNDRRHVYGVIDGQVGERGTLTFGYAIQDANTRGNMWGGLPFANSDGTQAEFPRDATTAQDWSRWDTLNHNGFVEAIYALAGDWQLKGTYNYRRSEEDSRLFYSFAETGLDPVTREGVVGYPGNYGGENSAHLGDVSLAGSFSAFGREHEANFGIAVSHGSLTGDTADPINDVSAGDPDPYPAMPGFPYAGNVAPEPIWGPRYVYTDGGQWLQRAYGAVRLGVTDRLKTLIGYNYTRFHRKGADVWGGDYEQSQSKFSPYAGFTFDITADVLAYASYSDIFQPQDQTDIDHQYLDPTKGVNLELGVKANWLDGRLLTSLAWFSAKQEELATQSPTPEIGDDGEIYWYYYGADVDSRGVELEAVGKLGDNVDLVLGFTRLQLKGPNGDDIYAWTPRRTANLALSVRLPSLPQLRVGLGGRWQSDVANFDDAALVSIRQGSYAVLNTFAEWQFNPALSLRANVDNLTDEKYIGSLYWVGYYGAPRNYALTLDYRF